MNLNRLLLAGLLPLMVGTSCAYSSSGDAHVPEEALAPAVRLERVDVRVEGCFPHGARGTATNGNAGDAGISITVRFFDESAQLQHVESSSLLLSAGESTDWSVPDVGEEQDDEPAESIRGYATCLVQKGPVRSGDVQSVYEGPVSSP